MPNLSARKRELQAHFDRMAPVRDRWRRRGSRYHAEIRRRVAEVVAPGQRVLELGVGTGELLNALQPRFGLGLDISRGMVREARAKHPHLSFAVADAEALPVTGDWDVIILSDLVGHLDDVLATLETVRALASPDTLIVVTYFNYAWAPILELAETVRLKMPQHIQNWLSFDDLASLLDLAEFSTRDTSIGLLFPARVPVLDGFFNRVLGRLPGVRRFGILEVLVAEPAPRRQRNDLTVSIVIPTKDERGNISDAVARTPAFGLRQELIFVDGNSVDGTVEAIEAEIAGHPELEISLLHQGDERGKKAAVYQGFRAAKYDLLMILDSDLTVPPEDLPKFYNVVASGRAEFANGSRLVYPMESGAMRALNVIANKLFSWAFTWLLDRRITDTLCGTKVLTRANMETIWANQDYFGDFDPFGDFDLLFGAAHAGFDIVDVPVRYRARTYGEIKIDRWRHGVLLLRMTVVAFRRLKLPKWRRRLFS